MLTAKQQHCLHGIGVRLWRERADDELSPETGETGDRPRFSADSGSAVQSVEAETVSPSAGVDEKRGQPPVSVEELPAGEVVEVPGRPPVDVAALTDWDATIAAIHACEACELAQNCTQKVPGVGHRKARLLIVGEGPGHEEDIRGEPFVGRSGQLLDRMLAAIGIARDEVYITNIVKCRPPNNRDPKQDEAKQCRAYLDAQIKLIEPRVILSVGRVSAHNLLDTNQPVGKLIQQMHQLPGTGIPVKVTYHPAYLLRNPSAKAIAWQDMKRLHQMLQ